MEKSAQMKISNSEAILHMNFCSKTGDKYNSTPFIKELKEDIPCQTDLSEIYPKTFKTFDVTSYDGPPKATQNAYSLPKKTITKKNRIKNIHPLYRKQWKRYRKRRKEIALAQNLLKIEQIKRK